MGWVRLLLWAVCACSLFGEEPLKGCLAAIQTAVANNAAGRWSESERELVRILAEASAKDRLCLGIASSNLAVVRQERGDIPGAEAYARRAVAALETGGPEFEMALTRPLQVLAELYLAERRFSKAKEVLARLEHMPASPKDRAAQAGSQALIAGNEGRWQDAERHYGSAIRAWEAAGEGEGVSVVPELTNLALLYLDQRRLAEAAPLLERARDIAERREASDELRLSAMTNLGVLYAKQGHWPAAAELLRKALQIAESGTGIGANARRKLYESYALVLRRTGQKREAKALQARADAVLPPDTSTMTVDAGDMANGQQKRR